MKWNLQVEPTNSRVPWNEKCFADRNSLQSYLEYFGIDKDYIGPGQYISCDGQLYKISVEGE